MERKDNYVIQAQNAKKTFLTYDQEALIRKLGLKADEDYLYVIMLGDTYRMNRRTGDIDRLCGEQWQDANRFAEVMTLLDLVCDCREDRFVSGRWKAMKDFGLMFHQNLLEGGVDPWAELFQANEEAFCRACESLGGKPLSTGDAAYALNFFDGLPLAVQLWLGDEEFPASLRILWDENALMYIKYETMHYAKPMILNRIRERMGL